MLRTNLATRPFYNERIVHLLLALAALVVLAVTAYDVGTWLRLRHHHAGLVAQVSGAESRAAELQREAARLRRSLNRADVDAVAKAASEANELIDRRTFSWTGLLGRFESTLPADVRILSVSPKVDEHGDLIVRVVVVGRQAEDVETFVEKLAETKSFDGLLSHEEIVNQDGLLEVTLEGRYLGPVTKPAASTH
jgi:hypothetical protein